jgi:hypothetical protein
MATAAVSILIDRGYAATTTLEVQKLAGAPPYVTSTPPGSVRLRDLRRAAQR